MGQLFTSLSKTIGLISSLIIRACRICSSDDILNNKFEHLRNVLNHNEYPKQVIDRKIKIHYVKKKKDKI
jgi:hypothetical protein